MPYVTKKSANSNLRILITGLSQSGKTTSLPTFIYGPYDYITQQQEATEYADNRVMAIIESPGETGHRSLPIDTPFLTSYYLENEEAAETQTYAYSKESIDQFWSIYNSVEKQKPHYLAIDGAHGIYDHMFNMITSGEWLAGLDMNITPSGSSDRYRSARFYNQAHRMFNQYLAKFYNSPVPFIVVTSWEEWQGAKNDSDKPAGIEAPRYLWPAFPGGMAIVAPGKFDARISARQERKCLTADCLDSKKGESHFVWQFLSRGDVQGVGIKGLKVNRQMKDSPWIHQNWSDLKELIETFS